MDDADVFDVCGCGAPINSWGCSSDYYCPWRDGPEVKPPAPAETPAPPAPVNPHRCGPLACEGCEYCCYGQA